MTFNDPLPKTVSKRICVLPSQQVPDPCICPLPGELMLGTEATLTTWRGEVHTAWQGQAARFQVCYFHSVGIPCVRSVFCGLALVAGLNGPALYPCQTADRACGIVQFSSHGGADR